jgi:3-oxoacid CoA-transferase subunit A
VPERLLDAVRDSGFKNLTFASNNASADNEGIGNCYVPSRSGR